MGAETKIRTRPTNVSLDARLVDEAKALGINISEASARGLQEAVRRARAQRWLDDNRAALDASNAFVDAKGLPLSGHRLF